MEADWVQPGRRVCVTGRGVSVGHWHPLIERVTKTQIVCEKDFRFTVDEPHSSIPRSEWGYYLHRTCQRKGES